jgi:hypothetical protein
LIVFAGASLSNLLFICLRRSADFPAIVFLLGLF